MIAEGFLYVPVSAEYQFFAEGAGGYKVLLDNTLLVENWNNADWVGSGRHSHQSLSKGFHPIRIEFWMRSRQNDGAFRVKWRGGPVPDNSTLSSPYLVLYPEISK